MVKLGHFSCGRWYHHHRQNDRFSPIPHALEVSRTWGIVRTHNKEIMRHDVPQDTLGPALALLGLKLHGPKGQFHFYRIKELYIVLLVPDCSNTGRKTGVSV